MKKTTAILLSLATTLCIFISGCNHDEIKSAVDYSDLNNWAYCENAENDKQADVFFIGPTTYSGKDGSFNMPLTDESIKNAFIGAVNMEKDIYDDSARFFAPFYSRA
ncbi:MAG: DUF3089 domain-containing protein, partial [Ruminiclostridium sp.]|nr:DUF3089 domain-containing protein [Ruminiclostridium sp.]